MHVPGKHDRFEVGDLVYLDPKLTKELRHGLAAQATAGHDFVVVRLGPDKGRGLVADLRRDAKLERDVPLECMRLKARRP